jgi:hypothetical protein
VLRARISAIIWAVGRRFRRNITCLDFLSQLVSMQVGLTLLLGSWLRPLIVLVGVTPMVVVLLLSPISAEPWWVDLSACKSVTSQDKAGISPGSVAL